MPSQLTLPHLDIAAVDRVIGSACCGAVSTAAGRYHRFTRPLRLQHSREKAVWSPRLRSRCERGRHREQIVLKKLFISASAIKKRDKEKSQDRSSGEEWTPAHLINRLSGRGCAFGHLGRRRVMLYNASALAGYALHATDGEIGSVEDFYFDDNAWFIRYLVADTGKWLPGRKVLLSPLSLGAVHLDGKKLDVKLTKDQVENTPATQTHKPISRQNEIRFYNYYSYPYYWSGPSAWGPIALPSQLPEIQPHMPKAEQREIL